MKFDLSRIEKSIAEPAVECIQRHGHTVGEGGIEVYWKIGCKDVLKVEFRGASLCIEGDRQVHFYRGLLIVLSELMKNGDNCTEFTREEKVAFQEMGIMVDCSRNGVAKVSFLKEMIRLCAYCGLNQMYLYMEDVYEIPGNPYFGAYRGRYTQSDLQEIDSYGRSFGVEIIPAIQTLAHLHTFLRWSSAEHLQDTADILMVGEKDTELFVRSMIENVSRPFTSKKIHVGMDEAKLLGLGRYLQLNGYENRYEIMTKHLELVYRICKENNLQPMIWSDMFFRLKSPTGNYYDLPETTEFNEIKSLPEEMSIVYWDYYHHEKSEYIKNLHLHSKLTNNISFATGGWTWNGIAPNYSKAKKTIKEGIFACKEQNIKKVFCTFWFDNGTETPMRTMIYPTIFFAQQCYGKNEQMTEQMVSLLTKTNSCMWKLLDKFDYTKGALPDNANADNPSKYLLYQDLLVGLFDAQIEGLHLSEHYKGLAEQLKESMDKIQEENLKNMFSYYIVLAEILEKKAELGLKIQKAYLEQNREAMKVFCGQIEECIDKIYSLKEMREKIWSSECNMFGFEVLDIRLGSVAIRMDTVKKRLSSWMDGRLEKIEELEEPRIIYSYDKENSEHKLCAIGFWQDMVSAGNISGI